MKPIAFSMNLLPMTLFMKVLKMYYASIDDPR
jgi:hypothetical protein